VLSERYAAAVAGCLPGEKTLEARDSKAFFDLRKTLLAILRDQTERDEALLSED